MTFPTLQFKAESELDKDLTIFINQIAFVQSIGKGCAIVVGSNTHVFMHISYDDMLVLINRACIVASES